MKLDLKTWVIVGLGIIIALLLLFDKDPQDDNAPLIAKITTRESQIHEMAREHAAHKVVMRQDSVLRVEERDHAIKNSVVLERNLARQRAKPEVIRVIQENASIDTLIQTYDSLLISKDFIIYSQEKQITQLYVDINEIERNFEHRLQLQSQSLEDYRTLSNEYKKDLRKERRKKRLASVLVPIALVGGLLFGN